MTAIVPPCEAASGRTPPAFFSSVVPASATWVATATCAGVVTVSVGEPVRGWLNRLNRNISVRIGRTRAPVTTLSSGFGRIPPYGPRNSTRTNTE
jgi:hypothetical protein